MPRCPGADPSVSIYYECSTLNSEKGGKAPEERILLIAGLACSLNAWTNEIKAIREVCEKGNTPFEGKVHICRFDNRGIGRSSAPEAKEQYTIDNMARDAIAVMEHLQWPSAHVVGHSMGSMISTRIGLIAKHKVDSLTLVSTARRFIDIWPRTFAAVRLYMKMIFGSFDDEGRALFDLQCHFTPEFLDEDIPCSSSDIDMCSDTESDTSSIPSHASPISTLSIKRRTSLKKEYMESSLMSINKQSEHGFKGQMHAVRNHVISDDEIEKLRETSFPFLMIHGSQDHIIPMQAGQNFFLRLRNRCKFLLLHGAHFISRERLDEVINAILNQIKEAGTNTKNVIDTI